MEKQQQLSLRAMNKICLFSASGHGKVIKEIIESEGNEVVAFIEDNHKNKKLLNIPIFKTDRINEFSSEKFIISIGDNLVRKKISKEFSFLYYTKSIHKQAVISKTCSIKKGTVVMPCAIVNAESRIGKHSIINTGSVIEHDCIVGDFVHVSPNATITGGVTVGEGTHIGAGAIVIPNLKIGKWVTIGAGAVIIKDVPDYAVVVGNPGNIIKYNKEL